MKIFLKNSTRVNINDSQFSPSINLPSTFCEIVCGSSQNFNSTFMIEKLDRFNCCCSNMENRAIKNSELFVCYRTDNFTLSFSIGCSSSKCVYGINNKASNVCSLFYQIPPSLFS